MKKLVILLISVMMLMFGSSAVSAACSHEWKVMGDSAYSTPFSTGTRHLECKLCHKAIVKTIPKTEVIKTITIPKMTASVPTAVYSFSLSAKKSILYQGREYIKLIMPANGIVSLQVTKGTNLLYDEIDFPYWSDESAMHAFPVLGKDSQSPVLYLPKGEYYILIQRDGTKDQVNGSTAYGKLDLSFKLGYITKSQAQLQDGVKKVSYVKGGTTNYHKLVVTKKGYLKIEGDMDGYTFISNGYVSTQLNLCTDTKKVLTDEFRLSYNYGKTAFAAVTPGTYYLSVTQESESAGYCPYSVKYTFTPAAASNLSKSTARSLSPGQATCSVRFADDSTNSGKLWYKIVLTSKKKVTFKVLKNFYSLSICKADGTTVEGFINSGNYTWTTSSALTAGTYYVSVNTDKWTSTLKSKARGYVYFAKYVS